MTLKIKRKIVNYKVNEPNREENSDSQQGTEAGLAAGVADTAVQRETASVIQMHETLQRPEMLVGSTYKLKVPEHVSAHAMYITINDIILNEGTEHESRRPFEVFINTKNLDHFQWIVALTVIMSAVFRKGGDITFLVDELRSVFDPRGGYWVKGSYKQSIIAEIGDVIERHLILIGMLTPAEPNEHQKELIRQKREALEKREAQAKVTNPDHAATDVDAPDKESLSDDSSAALTAAQASIAAANESNAGEDGFPPDARLCNKCNHRAAIIMDGCVTCLNCGDSKCG